MIQRIICALVAALALLGNAPASYAGAPGGFPSTPRLQGLFIEGTRVYPEVWAIKTSTEQRNTTVTIADDSQLTIPVEASKYYYIRVVLKLCGSTSGAMGYRFRMVATGGVDLSSVASQSFAINGTAQAWSAAVNVAFIDISDFATPAVSTCNSLDLFQREAVILTSSAGVIKLQWAQNSSNALNLNMFRGSYISAKKLN